MSKDYYMTWNEQRLMDIAEDADFIVAEDIIQAASDMPPQSVRNALSSLAGKGRLYRVKRGLYLRCEEPGKPVVEDVEKLATLVFKGYIAFAAALRHWGLLDYESFTVFVATRKKSGIRDVGEYRVQAVSMGDRAVGMIFHGEVHVSSLEKTVFDCLYKPQHSGGYPLVARAVSESEPDWKEVAKWFELLGSRSLVQRAGYVLARAGNAPDWLLRDFRSKAGTRVWLDPSGRRTGSYVREWKIMDNVGGWNDG